MWFRNNSKDAKSGFPLKITVSEIKVHENSPTEADLDFVQNVLPVLDWPALVGASTEIGLPAGSLPLNITDEMVSDKEFLTALFHVLMNVQLVRGVLTCPDTGKEFAVTDGIVEFMLNEEECT